MNRFPVLLAAMALACTAFAGSAAEPHVALVKSVSGQASIVQDGSRRPAEAGMQLHAGDRIVTASRGTAAIVFRDGTMLTVGPAADIHVRDYVFEPKAAKYAFSLYMAKGAAIYESGKIGKLAPEAVKVETPKATVGVRGTRFLVEAG